MEFRYVITVLFIVILLIAFCFLLPYLVSKLLSLLLYHAVSTDTRKANSGSSPQTWRASGVR